MVGAYFVNFCCSERSIVDAHFLNSVIPSGARNLSFFCLTQTAERFLAPLGMTELIQKRQNKSRYLLSQLQMSDQFSIFRNRHAA